MNNLILFPIKTALHDRVVGEILRHQNVIALQNRKAKNHASTEYRPANSKSRIG